MIKEVYGDLLKANVEAIINTVNTAGVMGKGLALQFRQQFPDNYQAYLRACEKGEVKPGFMFIFPMGEDNPRFIINFPTKRHWRDRSRMPDIESGLMDLVRVIKELQIRSIAVPPLGCGLGGLDWRQVRPKIENAFQELPEVEVHLYPPTPNS